MAKIEFGTLLIGRGVYAALVKEPAQARSLLLNGWPDKSTVNYKHALNACNQAMANTLTNYQARKAVERAAKEAGMLIECPKRK
jgi:Protein of unknown function (DUF982)